MMNNPYLNGPNAAGPVASISPTSLANGDAAMAAAVANAGLIASFNAAVVAAGGTGAPGRFYLFKHIDIK
jgi:hypothetical protein